MIEMSVEFVRVSMQNYNRVVILKEKESDRYLLIWIGPAEAEAIAMRLGDVQPPRPQTHDLLVNIIDSLGAHVSHVLVNDLNNDTFYARIVLDNNGQTVEIDSRTSDAIALAVRTQVPIYAEESVLERAGILLDKEPEQLTSGSGMGQNIRPPNPEELEKMSAFKDFIESLDLDDFGKTKTYEPLPAFPKQSLDRAPQRGLGVGVRKDRPHDVLVGERRDQEVVEPLTNAHLARAQVRIELAVDRCQGGAAHEVRDCHPPSSAAADIAEPSSASASRRKTETRAFLTNPAASTGTRSSSSPPS